MLLRLVDVELEMDALELMGFGRGGAEYRRVENRICSGRGCFLLRCIEGDEERIGRIIILHSELSGLTPPLAPGVYASEEGSRYVEVDSGRYFYLTEWIEGDPVRWRDQKDVFTAGRCIARLHEAGFDLINRAGIFVEPCGCVEQILEADQVLQLFTDVARNRVDRGAVDRLFLESVEHFREEVSGAVRMLESSPRKSESPRRESLCMKRFLEGLIIIGEGQDEAVITDCSLLGRDILAYDLVRMIGSVEEGLWDLSGTEALLEGYRSVRPFGKNDMMLLHALLIFPYRFYSAASNYYYNRRSPSESELLRNVEASIDEVRMRAEYLKRFSSLY